jgi:hypothetical protein
VSIKIPRPCHRFAYGLAGLLLIGTSALLADGSRVGSTFFPKPADGGIRRYPSVAYDDANDAYLVVWGLGQIGARFVSTGGTALGQPVTVNTTTGGPVRAACGADINTCLIAWVQEPTTIMGRLVRYSSGSVQLVSAPFVINQNGKSKLTSSPVGLTYSPSANEFLVAWTEYGPGPNVVAQRVSSAGSKAGGEVAIAVSTLWEGFPSLAYNSTLNEYMVVYYFETGSGTNNVAAQRVQPGSGSLIGGRNTVATSNFDQYPEVAYNTSTNQYFCVTWGFSGSGWMLRGRRFDASGALVGSSSLPIAVNGGGNGIGVAYNPVTATYIGVYQSQANDEVWGIEVDGNGVPSPQFQATVSGTTLASQPQAAGGAANGRWLVVASEGFKRVMAQLVERTTGSPTAPPPPTPTGGCTTVQPGANWTCVNGSWLPPTTTTTTTGCTTASPGTGWTCVNGSWLPPTTTTPTSSCTTVKPGTNWTCVNGSWLPPTTTTTTTGCTTASPGTGWTCVNGSWLPPTTTTTTSSCTTVKPGTYWTCVNGNWLPPGSVTTTTTTSGCTTVSPGPGWTCVNGGWLPTTSSSSCTTVKPGTYWTCVNGNWLPPGY